MPYGVRVRVPFSAPLIYKLVNTLVERIMFNKSDAGWSSLVARRAHNPKVVGSNPAPATNPLMRASLRKVFFLLCELNSYCLIHQGPATETSTYRGFLLSKFSK